jgi:hypothetical protein
MKKTNFDRYLEEQLRTRRLRLVLSGQAMRGMSRCTSLVSGKKPDFPRGI